MKECLNTRTSTVMIHCTVSYRFSYLVVAYYFLIAVEVRQMAASGVHSHSVRTPKRVAVRVSFTVTIRVREGLSSDTWNWYWNSHTRNSNRSVTNIATYHTSSFR